MATEIYLGNPPANIVDWIKNHTQPAVEPSPYFTYDSNRVITGLHQGEPNIQGEGGWTYGGGSDLVENYATTIGDNAFNDNSYVNSGIPPSKAITGNITFQNVTSIGNSAFRFCGQNRMTMTMPNVTSIGNYAFSYCWLTNVTMPNATNIGHYAFETCNLTNVTMPNVISIGHYAFIGCTYLTSVTIGSRIQGIGSSAFDPSGQPITLQIDKTVAEVQAMGTTEYDSNTNVPYSEWGLPSGSTIVCTGGTIPID